MLHGCRHKMEYDLLCAARCNDRFFVHKHDKVKEAHYFMRKFQKQQLLEVITSLHFLHQEIRDRLSRNEYPTVQNALVDCQEAAIQVGEAIEQMAGMGTEAVAYLEKYCERIYQVSVQLEEIQAQKAYKSLESILIKAENAISHMPVRKEVVFLPYKASMWDSLESVYLAAKEDENCDAYCVPIPYYDRKSDGSLGEMHYDGNEYPKNIEITDYRAYNLEERHPDAIYIHNPYDEWNNVTCVPERYFCKNLCHNTECLVYIPYFVLGDIEPDDQEAIEKMKHFCFLPGIIYSHKVVVQSEKIRQIYINEYIKEAKQLGLPVDRKGLEEKILGLGSPKFDKVQNTRKEDLEIPKEWMQVIEKPDGTWKKIVFYNTSINALLKHDEKMLEKMKAVFQIFKKNRDEVALLWRPHPLIPNTIKSMRPQLWVEYEKIVDEYRKAGWGIYDDSADMDRAVVLSDAYYGDYSSVASVYTECGKNVVYQDVKNDMNIDCYPDMLCCNDMVIENGYLYLCAANFDGLCKIDFDNLKVDYIGYTAHEYKKQYSNQRLYCAIFFENNKIICIPRYSEFILIFDIKTKDARKIAIPYSEPVKKIRFFSAVRINEKIYCFSEARDGVVIFNIEEENVIVFEYDSGRIHKKEDYYFTVKPAVFNHKIYAPYYLENKILVFDIDTNTINEILIDNEETGYISCDILQNYLCMISRNHKLLFYDLNANLCEESIEIEGAVFSGGNKVWVMDSKEKKIKIIEFNKKERLIYDFVPKEEEFWNQYSITGSKKIDGQLYIMMEKQEKAGIYIFDLQTKNERLMRYDCGELKSTLLSMQYHIEENELPVNIMDLFNAASTVNAKNEIMNCGINIWDQIER